MMQEQYRKTIDTLYRKIDLAENYTMYLIMQKFLLEHSSNTEMLSYRMPKRDTRSSLKH